MLKNQETKFRCLRLRSGIQILFLLAALPACLAASYAAQSKPTPCLGEELQSQYVKDVYFHGVALVAAVKNIEFNQNIYDVVWNFFIISCDKRVLQEEARVMGDLFEKNRIKHERIVFDVEQYPIFKKFVETVVYFFGGCESFVAQNCIENDIVFLAFLDLVSSDIPPEQRFDFWSFNHKSVASKIELELNRAMLISFITHKVAAGQYDSCFNIEITDFERAFFVNLGRLRPIERDDFRIGIWQLFLKIYPATLAQMRTMLDKDIDMLNRYLRAKNGNSEAMLGQLRAEGLLIEEPFLDLSKQATPFMGAFLVFYEFMRSGFVQLKKDHGRLDSKAFIQILDFLQQKNENVDESKDEDFAVRWMQRSANLLNGARSCCPYDATSCFEQIKKDHFVKEQDKKNQAAQEEALIVEQKRLGKLIQAVHSKQDHVRAQIESEELAQRNVLSVEDVRGLKKIEQAMKAQPFQELVIAPNARYAQLKEAARVKQKEESELFDVSDVEDVVVSDLSDEELVNYKSINFDKNKVTKEEKREARTLRRLLNAQEREYLALIQKEKDVRRGKFIVAPLLQDKSRRYAGIKSASVQTEHDVAICYQLLTNARLLRERAIIDGPLFKNLWVQAAFDKGCSCMCCETLKAFVQDKNKGKQEAIDIMARMSQDPGFVKTLYENIATRYYGQL